MSFSEECVWSQQGTLWTAREGMYLFLSHRTCALSGCRLAIFNELLTDWETIFLPFLDIKYRDRCGSLHGTATIFLLIKNLSVFISKREPAMHLLVWGECGVQRVKTSVFTRTYLASFCLLQPKSLNCSTLHSRNWRGIMNTETTSSIFRISSIPRGYLKENLSNGCLKSIFTPADESIQPPLESPNCFLPIQS